MLFLSDRRSSLRCFTNTPQKLDEDQDYEPIYSPMLRSNLTIHRTPTIAYEESTLSKTGNIRLMMYVRLIFCTLYKLQGNQFVL